MVQILLIPIICLDQLRAVTNPIGYWEIFQVKHYSVVVIIICLIWAMYLSTIGVLFYDVGFGNPGPATCRLLSPPEAPWLQIPTSITPISALLLALLFYTAFILKLRSSSSRVRMVSAVIRLVTFQVVINSGKLSPVVVILISRQLNLSQSILVALEWMFIMCLVVVPILNPIAFGGCSSAYRRGLVSCCQNMVRQPRTSLSSMKKDSSGFSAKDTRGSESA